MTEPASAISPLRVLIVVLGLVVVGIFIGAACALSLLPILFGRIPTLADLSGPIAFVVGTMGALFGAFLAPIAGFSLLRRVALGRAILWTTGGTLIGGVIGIALGGIGVTLGPMMGFGCAAFRLWTETTELGRRRRRIPKGAA